MNLQRSLLALSFLGGVLATSAVATTVDAHAKSVAALKIEAPVLTKMVSPTGLTRRHSETITLTFTVDASGKPQDVKIVSVNDRSLERSLVPAVRQWEFTPARRNGVVVPMRVVLPIELVEA